MAPPLHRTVGGLGLATIVAYGGWFYGFGVLVQPISDDTGWSVATLGAAYAVAQLLTGVAAAFGGRLLDRRGGRWTFALGGVVGAGLLGVAATARSAPVFVAAFALGGGVVGATGFYHVTMAAARRLRPEAPARAIGPLTIWGAFASPIFLPVTAWLVQAAGWRTTLLTLAVTTAAGLLIAAVLAPGGAATAPASSDEPDTPVAVALRAAWHDAAARRLLVLVAGSGVGVGLLLTYQVPMMVAFGLPLTAAAAVAGARGLLQLTGRVGLSAIVERAGSSRPLAAAMALSTVACALMAGSGSLPVAIAFAVVAGASMGATSPLVGVHASAILPERHLGALLGAVHAVGGVATAAGPLVGGVLRDATGSYVPALVIAGIGFVVGGVAMVSARGWGHAGLRTGARPRMPSPYRRRSVVIGRRQPMSRGTSDDRHEPPVATARAPDRRLLRGARRADLAGRPGTRRRRGAGQGDPPVDGPDHPGLDADGHLPAGHPDR